MEAIQDKIRVLVVSSKFPPEPSGSGLRAQKTYKRLRDKFGVQYEVLTSSVMYNNVSRYSFEDAQVMRISCKLFKNVLDSQNASRSSFFEKMARCVKNGSNYMAEALITWAYLLRAGSRFDIFHVFGNSGYMTAAVITYAKVFNKPVIIESCNVPVSVRPFYEPFFVRLMFGEGLPECSKVICISERLKKMWAESGLADDIWCRPNPVDGSKFFPDMEKRLKYRKELGLFSEKDTVLITVGKIRPLKNQIFLVDVLKRLPAQYKLVIAGPSIGAEPYAGEEAGYLDQIRAKIKDLDLADKVKIEDRFIEDVDKYMKASDLYVMPSKMEACATALLEALACGLPAVANRIEGVTADWLEDGVTGYLSGLDEKEFSEKIMMAASLDAKRLKERTREISARCSTDSIDEVYTDIMREMKSRCAE